MFFRKVVSFFFTTYYVMLRLGHGRNVVSVSLFSDVGKSGTERLRLRTSEFSEV